MKINIIQGLEQTNFNIVKNMMISFGLTDLSILTDNDLELNLNSSIEDLVLKLNYNEESNLNYIILTSKHLLLNSYNNSVKFKPDLKLIDIISKSSINLSYQIFLPKYDSKILKVYLNEASRNGSLENLINDYNIYVNEYNNNKYFINLITDDLDYYIYLNHYVLGGNYAK